MSFPSISVNGGVHICLPYIQQVRQCAKNTSFPRTDCLKQREDYFQCHKKEKLLKLVSQAEKELRKARVINVPYYDKKEDRFVFDDGKIVSNTDPIFKQFASR